MWYELLYEVRQMAGWKSAKTFVTKILGFRFYLLKHYNKIYVCKRIYFTEILWHILYNYIYIYTQYYGYMTDLYSSILVKVGWTNYH